MKKRIISIILCICLIYSSVFAATIQPGYGTGTTGCCLENASPKPVIREALQKGVLSDVPYYMNMLDSRSMFAHEYGLPHIQILLENIKALYADVLLNAYTALKERTDVWFE